MLSEEKLKRIQAGLPKLVQRLAYKKLASKRLQLKKRYLAAKENGDTDALKIFLSSIGHNVAKSTMSGRVDEPVVSQSPMDVEFTTENSNHDNSSWKPASENSVLEELHCEDPYVDRRVGKKCPYEWKNKKCPSCSFGFTSKSNPIKCHDCDAFTHNKNKCLSVCDTGSNFFVKSINRIIQEETQTQLSLLECQK